MRHCMLQYRLSQHSATRSVELLKLSIPQTMARAILYKRNDQQSPACCHLHVLVHWPCSFNRFGWECRQTDGAA